MNIFALCAFPTKADVDQESVDVMLKMVMSAPGGCAGSLPGSDSSPHQLLPSGKKGEGDPLAPGSSNHNCKVRNGATVCTSMGKTLLDMTWPGPRMPDVAKVEA